MGLLLNEQFTSDLSSWEIMANNGTSTTWLWNTGFLSTGSARSSYTSESFGPSRFLYQSYNFEVGVTYRLEFKVKEVGGRGLAIYVGGSDFSDLNFLPGIGSVSYLTGTYSLDFEIDEEFGSIGFQADFAPSFSDEGDYIEVEYFTLTAISCNLEINSITTQNPTTVGGEDGEVTIVASSVNDDIEYSLDNTTWQSSSNFDELTAGQYTIYVRDEAECTAEQEFTLCDISISTVVVNASTNGASDGQITVNSSSTSSSIVYSKDNVNYYVSNVFSGLPAGTYTVYALDSFGCKKSANVTITQPVPEPVTCFNPTISISELNPYKFKLLKCNPDDETEDLFNEVEICGVNKECFTQIAKCNDALTFQVYYLDEDYETIPVLNILDYYDDTLYETVNFVSLGSNYYKLEKNISEIPEICEKTVYLVISSRNPDTVTQYYEHAKSEPILVSNYHNCSLLLEYWNDNNYNSMRYEGTAVGYVNKMRIFAQNWKEEFPQEKVVYVKSNGESVLIKSEVKEKRLLEVGYVPNYIHKIIALALSHQHVRIGSTEYVSEDEYSFDNLNRYALSTGKGKLSTKQYLKKNQIR